MSKNDNIGRLHALSPRRLFRREATQGGFGNPAGVQAGRVKAIEEVRVGDWVWARGPGGPVKRQVRRLFRHGEKAVVRVRYAGCGGGDVHEVVATEGHPFWVRGKGWVAARDLNAGDALLPLCESQDPRVTAVVRCDRKADVFNFEVEGHHNYFAGRQGVLVHNASVRRAPDVWGAKNGIPLPPVGSDQFARLVRGIHEQFSTTRSYAAVPTSLSSTHPAPGRLPVPAHSPNPGIFGSFAAIDQPATYVSFARERKTTPGPLAIASMESLRVWGHHLLRESFGADVSSVSHAQYHYAPAREKPPGGAGWHTDGPQIVYGFTISTTGPGTHVLQPQPGKPGRWSTDGEQDNQALAVPTWWLTVFAGDGVLRHRQTGHLPTVHREPPSFSVDRSLYLVRVGDGLGD